MAEMVVVETAAEAAEVAAERFAAAAEAAIAARGRFTVALSGGSTPAALYRLLAQAPLRERVDWSRTLVFFGDERCVPIDHAWSNYGAARETLLGRVPVPATKVHRILGELGPASAAAEYEWTLRAALDPGFAAGTPVLDLVLLGMGDDGHTASLFPGMPALDEAQAAVVATDVPAYVRPAVPRVTLTLPVLNAARSVLFLVTGASKAAAAARILAPKPTPGPVPDPLPAARVTNAHATWILDRDAAAGLHSGVLGSA